MATSGASEPSRSSFQSSYAIGPSLATSLVSGHVTIKNGGPSLAFERLFLGVTLFLSLTLALALSLLT